MMLSYHTNNQNVDDHLPKISSATVGKITE